MKKVNVLMIAILFPAAFVGNRAAGAVDPGFFHSVVVSSEIVAELVLSKNTSVVAEFENADQDDLIVEVVDSVLHLRMKTGTYKNAVLKVKIYYTVDLRMLEANGRARIWSDEDLYFERDLTLKLFNGGEMRFRLLCDSLSANLSQGSIVYLTGEARAEQVKVSTGATFSGYEFRTREAHVTATGGGKAKVSADEYLDAFATSKGFIGYVGEPVKVDRKTSLMGEVLKTFLEE